MSILSDRVKEWRKRTKERMVLSMGGKCQCCGYNRCNDALEFHHRDKTQKDFSFASARASCKSWKHIVEELKKCILICAVCHREIHAGIRELPLTADFFNEIYDDYKVLDRKNDYDLCPICVKEKPIFNITCSRSCAAKKRMGNKWDGIDIIELSKSHSLESIGRMVGCTGVAVKKRLKKLKTMKKLYKSN